MSLEHISPEVIERAKKVTALVMDVDGTLTDGRIIFAQHGDELKCFNVQDGAGLVIWERAGGLSALITARKSKLVKRRAKDMRVKFVFQGHEKLAGFEQFLRRFRLSPEQVCAVADDLMDLPILRRAGLAVTVPDGVPEVKAISHYQTQRAGGKGAVREVIELILKARGLWDQALEHYQH